jgi:hypothetical protein
MKVKVNYTVQRTEEVEIDDKFLQLSESGGWYDLTYKEQDKLTNELLEILTQVTPANYHDINFVEYDYELLYEG